MKILIVSTSDVTGGAARAAYRLHRALRQAGADARMLVLSRSSGDPRVLGPRTPLGKLSARFYDRLHVLVQRRYRLNPAIRFSIACSPHNLARRVRAIAPDVIHLHWVNGGFLRIEQLPHLGAPIAWTLHDMWAFTGGCHYDQSCGRYVAQCGACPVLGSTKERDLSRWVHRRKARAYARIPHLTVVPVSQWLADCARQSSLFANRPVEVIPNGIDADVFKPVDKRLARQMLNLPLDQKLVLFGNLDGTDDPRKGFHLLIPALNLLRDPAVELLVFGASEAPPTATVILQSPVHYLGKFSDDVALAVMYSAADVVVVPSTQENLSNVIMEALACGTPVAAFAIGGNGDLIDHQQNGYLARPFEVADLAAGIAWLTDGDARRAQLSRQARQKVWQHYCYPDVARQHLELYQRMVGASQPVALDLKPQ